MKHLLRFLGLAAGLAFAGGMVLAGIALLLAMPAYADESGLRLRNHCGGESLAAPLLSTDASLRVTGALARVRVVQTFRNPHDAWYEGVYVFALPQTAAVDRLRLLLGERVIEGEIRERAAAKAVRGQARNTGRRAALLEEEQPNLFTTQVANIGPRETVMVELEYQQILRIDNARFSSRLPMVIGPRYVRAGSLPLAQAQRIAALAMLTRRRFQ